MYKMYEVIFVTEDKVIGGCNKLILLLCLVGNN